jgi:hypothetical protein
MFAKVKTPMKLKHTIFSLGAAGLVAALFSGCTSTKVTSQNQYLGFLPKPHRVLVYDFAVSPDEVELDSGLAKLDELAKKESRNAQELVIGRKVAAAMSTNLLKEVQALGIPAIHATKDTPVQTTDLLLKGQFISIDEGNAAERVVIGLGLGRTDVKTMTQVYGFVKGQKSVVDEFDVNAESGRKPGMAETMGAGALTGHLLVSAVASTGVAVGSEAFSANVEADTKRTAKIITQQLKVFYLDQGWVQP